MEIQEKNIESNKGKKLITMRQLILLLFSLFLIFLGFIVGRESNIIEEKNDLKVYINGEEQVFRNSSGHKVYPILKDDQIYIPVSGLGSFLGYMTIQNDENNIYLYEIEEQINNKIIEGFSTETFDGKKIDDSIFSEADYTVLMLWATWCKYCKAEIEDFRSLSSYLEKNNIQILSLPIDAPVLGDKNNLTSEFRSQVEKITNGVSIKYTIFRDTIISNRFLGNAISIPTLVIFDNEGNMIKKIDFDINSDDFIRIFDAIIGEE